MVLINPLLIKLHDKFWSKYIETLFLLVRSKCSVILFFYYAETYNIAHTAIPWKKLQISVLLLDKRRLFNKVFIGQNNQRNLLYSDGSAISNANFVIAYNSNDSTSHRKSNSLQANQKKIVNGKPFAKLTQNWVLERRWPIYFSDAMIFDYFSLL